jgi:hypothetical protein
MTSEGELDLSRPVGRPSDRRRLIEGILAGTLGVDETIWLEWKSQVDWNSPVDVAIKVARHVIGFANRDPVEAQAFVGGEAYLVLLPDPAQPDRARIDPADIENKIAPYLGTDGPHWSASHVDLNGRVSLVLTVAPPRVGDHIHALRKQAANYPNGAVFIRRPGKTEQADSVDIRRLELRAQVASSPIAIEVLNFEQLRRVADQVAHLVRYRRSVRQAFLEHNPPPWHDHNDAQTVLAADLAGLAEDLPKCREMVTADPRYTDRLDAEASSEIKNAIGAARSRLDELAAAATAQPTRAQGSP